MTDLQRITVEYDCERITIEDVQNKKIVFYFLCGNRYYTVSYTHLAIRKIFCQSFVLL